MPIVNIVDKRKNAFNVEVDCVFEPSFHDNCVEHATHYPSSGDEIEQEFDVEHVYNTNIQSVLKYAEKWDKIPVTVYLYDAGSKPVG